MKKLIITIASLLIMVEHIVAGAGVVVVSDPGQEPSGNVIFLGTTHQFIEVYLTTSDSEDQTVYLTVHPQCFFNNSAVNARGKF